MQEDFSEEFRRRVEGRKVLILGVGNRVNGDDGLGPRLVGRLKGKLSVPILDAGIVPENRLRQIEAARADLVLVLDTADLHATPGEHALFELNELDGLAISTHTVNLRLLFRVIPAERRPEVLVLAVQPDATEPGAKMSYAMRAAMEGLESLLLAAFPC